MRERAEIEGQHSKTLKTWARKWHASIQGGTEYGSIAEAWHAVADEAEQQAELHARIRERLLDEVCTDDELITEYLTPGACHNQNLAKADVHYQNAHRH